MKIRQSLSRLSAVCLLTGMIGVSAAQAQSYGSNAVDMQPTFSGQNTDTHSVMNTPGQPGALHTHQSGTSDLKPTSTTTRVLIAPATTTHTQQRSSQNLSQLSPQQTPAQQNTVDANSVPKAYRGYDPASNPDPVAPPTINYVVESANTTAANTSNTQTDSETLGPDIKLEAGDIYPYLSDNNTETTRVDRSERLIIDADADDADNGSPFNGLYILLFSIIAISVVAAVYMVQRYRTENNVRPLR